MGRSNFQLHFLSTADTSGCPYVQTYLTAGYDLAGNQTSLTYPSGRAIKSQFNGASRPTKIFVDDFNGYNYLSSANYGPFGSPTSFALGNGATETSTYNKRLQPLNQQLANTTSTLLNRTYSFYDTSGHNNGNVISIADNLNSSLTQNFSYDSLNRISTAQTSGTSGPNCWGQQFGYDAWGNLLTETPNVPGCPTNMLNLGVNTNNQITNTGFAYDAAGNMTNDGSNVYAYDAENHLTSLNSGAATYIYDAQGRRMAKKIGSATTEYIYFNGDVLAEYNLGDQVWSDYIFAGGRRLAAAGTDDVFNAGFEQGLEGWIAGASDSSGSEQVITDPARAHLGNNYLQLSTTTAQVIADNQVVAVNPGDQLTFGGWAYLESGSASGAYVGWNLIVRDANGNVLAYPVAGNATSATWALQSATYTVPAGGASVALYAQIYLPTGSTTARFDDAFLTGASGLGVRYYHADHLGSARLMTDSSGNQTWSATYLPFGQEWNPQPTTNHYKFTGKERDSESALDNFGARYCSSSLGRFMSPDWSDEPQPIPYADLGNPQSLNLYSYVQNNPLTLLDDDGHANDDAPAPAGKCGFVCQLKLFFRGWKTSNSSNPLPAKEPSLRDYWRAYWYSNDPDYKRYLIGKMLGIQAVTVPTPGGQNTVGPPLGFLTLPTNVLKALEMIDMWGGLPGAGPAQDHPYANDGRNPEDEILPQTDSNGNPITYRTWDVNPQTPGVSRDRERIVTGSDGSAWYTDRHYRKGSFKRIR